MSLPLGQTGPLQKTHITTQWFYSPQEFGLTQGVPPVSPTRLWTLFNLTGWASSWVLILDRECNNGLTSTHSRPPPHPTHPHTHPPSSLWCDVTEWEPMTSGDHHPCVWFSLTLQAHCLWDSLYTQGKPIFACPQHRGSEVGSMLLKVFSSFLFFPQTQLSRSATFPVQRGCEQVVVVVIIIIITISVFSTCNLHCHCQYCTTTFQD